MPESSKGPVKELSKVLKVPGDAVGQAALEVRPDPFIGVKLRRISGEVKGMDARRASKEFLGELGLVERTAVPEEDERPSEVTREMSEELPDLFAPEILVGIKAGVESEAFPLRRDRDGRDGRDFGPSSGNNEGWGFAFDRPGSLEVGDKGESALIQEDQAGLEPIGLFLYAARRDASSNGWLAPGAPWPASAAFGNSNPGRPSDSKGFRCNSVLGSSSGRPGQFVSKSKDPSGNRLPRVLSLRRAPKSSSACPTDAGAAPDAAWTSSLTGHSCGRPDANGLKSSSKRLLPWRLNGKADLDSIAGRPDAAVFRVPEGSHGVS